MNCPGLPKAKAEPRPPGVRTVTTLGSTLATTFSVEAPALAVPAGAAVMMAATTAGSQRLRRRRFARLMTEGQAVTAAFSE